MALDSGEMIFLMEQVSIRRHVRPQTHFTLTSNVVLFGYRQLSDAEKLTYQAIESFDWTDEKGERKGYAFPSIDTLAARRGLDRRSIFRHLDALEKSGLLAREVRSGRPTLLHLHGPSSQETNAYLSTIATGGGDKDVTPTHDKVVTPYKKEELETDKTVNGVENVFEERSSGWKRYRPRIRLSKEQRLKRDWLAGEILKVTKDPHSLGFYRRVSMTLRSGHIFAAISHVNEAAMQGSVLRSRGAYFNHLVKARMEELA